MERDGLARFGCAAACILAVVGLLGGGIGYLVSEMVGGDADPWIEQDGVLAVSLLGTLAEEYHVQRRIAEIRGSLPAKRRADPQTSKRAALALMRTRFTERLEHVADLLGDRVITLAVQKLSKSKPPTNLLTSGRFPRYDVEKASRFVQGRTKTDVTVEDARMDGKPVLVFSKPVSDRFSDGGKQLPWKVFVVIDPEASTTANGGAETHGVLAAALLAGLAEEYHVLKRIERVRSGLARFEEHEKAGRDVDDEAKRDAALAYTEMVAQLDARYAQHLENARALVNTRCMSLAIVDNRALGGPEALFQTADIGRFKSAKRQAFQRNGKRTGFNIATGRIRRTKALETTAPIRDLWASKGKLPWRARVWLNVDPNQVPAR